MENMKDNIKIQLARSQEVQWPHERKRQVFRKMELKVGRSRPRNISRRINAQG